MGQPFNIARIHYLSNQFKVIHADYHMLLIEAIKNTNVYMLELMFIYEYTYISNTLLFIKFQFPLNNGRK